MNKNSGKISINSNGFLYVKMFVILSILKVEYWWSENLKSEMLQNPKLLMPTGEKGTLALVWPITVLKVYFKIHWKYYVKSPKAMGHRKYMWNINEFCV